MSVKESAQSLVDALSIALGRPVLLDDAQLIPLAYSRQWDVDAVRSESILSRGPSHRVKESLFAQGIAKAPGVLRTTAVPELGMAERLCIPVRHRGSCLGYIWLLDPEHQLTGEDLVRARTAAAAMGRVLAEPATPVADETTLLRNLCSSEASVREHAVVEARGRGLLVDESFVLCLLHSFDGLDPVDAARRGVRHLSAGHAIAGAIPEGAAVLATLTDPVLHALPNDETAAWLHTLLHASAAIGQSAESHVDGLSEAARQAKLALAVARTNSRDTAFAAWSTMGPDRLITQLPHSAYADVPERLQRLLKDEPELADTLAAFLDSGGDIKVTTAAISLGRSGLYYRLRRIEEISGLNLRSGSDRLLAQLALRTAHLF